VPGYIRPAADRWLYFAVTTAFVSIAVSRRDKPQFFRSRRSVNSALGVRYSSAFVAARPASEWSASTRPTISRYAARCLERSYIRRRDVSLRSRLSESCFFPSRHWLREQVRPGLRERHISAGRMHSDPAMRDGGFHGHGIFIDWRTVSRRHSSVPRGQRRLSGLRVQRRISSRSLSRQALRCLTSRVGALLRRFFWAKKNPPVRAGVSGSGVSDRLV